MLFLIYVVACLIYVAVYTFASFLFNYKVYLVNHEKYVLGTLISGAGIFINFALYAIVPYIAIATQYPTLAFALLAGLGIGAYFSNAVLTKIDFFHNNDEKDKKEEE